MTGLGLAIYILMFPVIAAVVVGVIWVASFREFRQVRRDKRHLV